MDKEKELLKAIGDIDDKFIEEARPEKVVRLAPKRNMKPLGVMAAAAVIVLGLGLYMTMNLKEQDAAVMAPAPIEEAAEAKSEQSTAQDNKLKTAEEPLLKNEIEAAEDAAPEAVDNQLFTMKKDAAVGAAEPKADDSGKESRMMIANPWKDSDSLDEAVEDAGFDIRIPESLKGYSQKFFRSIKGDMLEIIYCDSESIEGFRIRKAHGTEDISGDYNTYETDKDLTINDMRVKLKKNGDDVFAATWTKDDFSFAITVDEAQHFTEDDISKLIQEIS